ncbi:MAG: hypothetical protein HFI76_15180 [Lachnospiraceae bacterium]|nr:hypothetical protein [Lachnospiraceae bacterium]
MKGILAAAGIFAAATLYSCIRAGAQEDRRMEEMKRRGEWDAGRKGRQREPGEG